MLFPPAFGPLELLAAACGAGLAGAGVPGAGAPAPSSTAIASIAARLKKDFVALDPPVPLPAACMVLRE